MNDTFPRRHFLRAVVTSLAGCAAPCLVPGVVLGQGERVAASNRIVLGCVGLGAMGTRNLELFLGEPDCQVVAVCDVDQQHAETAKLRVNRHYQNQDCRVYYDFRELLLRPDLDAVALALPDHWHAIPAVQAARAGKDIYSEPPLSHTLREGRAVCEAVRRYARVWQTAHGQRCDPECCRAAELVRTGRLGKVNAIELGLAAGHPDLGGTAGQESPVKVPTRLDYEFWLGPAPWAPYCPARVHGNWRWHLDYGGGQLMDGLGQSADLALWAVDRSHTGPIEVEAAGEFPRAGLWNAATKYRVSARYLDGLTLTIAGGHPDIRAGTRWLGERGWVAVDRGRLEAEPRELLQERLGPAEIRLPPSSSRPRDFLECVKSRGATFGTVESAHRSAAVGHLGQIAMRVGRRLRWNPETEDLLGDAVAGRMLSGVPREPWTL
jgi:predicted dehydrogenase